MLPANVYGVGLPLASPPTVNIFSRAAVEPHFEGVRPSDADDVVVELPLQPDLDDILAVHREPVAHRETAARSERQIFAGAIVLRHQFWRLIRLDDRRDVDVADREAADALRRSDVPLEQRRRYRQHAGDVLEPVLIRIVARQERARIGVDREKIANRVRVLGAIQAVQDDAARIGMRRSVAIDGRFEPGGQVRVGLGIRPAADGCRRHFARPQLGDYALPEVSMRRHAREIGLFEIDPAACEPRVVTADTGT